MNNTQTAMEERESLLDFTKSIQFTLAMEIGSLGCTISVYNPIRNFSFYVVKQVWDSANSLLENLKNLFKEHPFLNNSFKRVHLIFNIPKFTTVPQELFKSESAEQLFYFNHAKQDNEQLLTYSQKRTQSVLIYAVNKAAVQFLAGCHTEALFYPHVGVMTEYFANKSRLGNSQKMYAFIQAQEIELFCYSRGKLLLCNRFACEDTATRVYYLLHSWKQLLFDQTRDELHLVGKLADKEELLKQLKQFVQQVFVQNRNSEVQSVTDEEDDMPLNLQIVSLCEL